MALLDEVPLVLPPEMAALYRATWPSSDLLAEAVGALAPTSRVLVLGCAADPVTLVLAARVAQGACVVADDDAAAGRRLTALAAQAGITSLRVADPAALATSAGEASAEPFDVGLSNSLYHPSKHMTLRLLRLCRALIRPGASVYVAGAKDRGMLSIAEEMGRLFGNASVLVMRKGHRVVSSERQPGDVDDGGQDGGQAEPLWPRPSSSVVDEVTLRGAPYQLVESPLVFADGRLDPAAAMLAAAIAVGETDTVADLGCGAGVVGLVAARLAVRGRVYLIDSSYLAVRTALSNAARNGIGNVTALAGDGPTILAEQHLRPDVVVMNPPFHQGQVEARQEAARWIRSAAACLALGGRLFVVANRFLSYESPLRANFTDVREEAGNERFKVLLAERVRTDRR